MAEKTLDQILEAAAVTVDELPLLGMKARSAARSAIRILEDQVVSALSGAKLMGQPNLGTSNDRFNGINVRSDDFRRKLKQGKPTLVIDRDGSLAMVCYGRDDIVVEPFDMSRAKPEDLESVSKGYALALAHHLVAAKKASRRYRSVEVLATALLEALEKTIAWQKAEEES